MSVIQIIFDEASCAVRGSFPELEARLYYEHRSLDMDADGRPIRTEWKSMFNVLPPCAQGRRCIQTYHGLLPDVLACCAEHGYQVEVSDQRPWFPMAALHRMHGFRFSQRKLLTEALAQSRSGLIGAPTRYGKTTLLINTIRAYPQNIVGKTVVTAPGIDLLKQTELDIREKCPDRHVTGIYTTSKGKHQGPDITVCSLDSLEKCDLDGTRLVLVDEPHAAVTTSRGCYLSRFANARKLGFGATLKGRFDQADVLIRAIIGPVLANVSYVEARNEGAVAPIEVALLRMKLKPFDVTDRDVAYSIVVHRSPPMHQLIAKICREALPEDWQTLIFIKNEDQAKGIYKEIPEGTIAMAKLLTGKERAALTERVKRNEIKRCIASDIYSQGVTFHEVRALINAGGGGGSISCVQKPGRLAEIRPGKKCGVVIDFLWDIDFTGHACEGLPLETALSILPNKQAAAWLHVYRDSLARIRVYEEKGYNITTHDSVVELGNFIKGSCV